MRIAEVISHPLTRGLSLDDPRTTTLRRHIIRSKPFLERIYKDWYEWIASSVPQGKGRILELGSGAGFLKDFIPGLLTSEVFRCTDADVVLDGRHLPFRSGVLKAIVMVDVFHHIPDAGAFLEEASRCLAPYGVVLMVEPWVTPFSRFVYSKLHHEPIDTGANEWSFPRSGPLSSANSALPWIVFERDHELFRRRFTDLKLMDITVEKPFVYLLSGGVSTRLCAPAFLYDAFSAIEHSLRPWMRYLGMFARIRLQKSGWCAA
jgi:SAM-dependent methyltransferase